MCACAFYQLQDHWMFLLPRRSTRLVTEESNIYLFFLHSYTMIFTNLVTFHMMRFSEAGITFRSVTDSLE